MDLAKQYILIIQKDVETSGTPKYNVINSLGRMIRHPSKMPAT